MIFTRISYLYMDVVSWDEVVTRDRDWMRVAVANLLRSLNLKERPRDHFIQPPASKLLKAGIAV